MITHEVASRSSGVRISRAISIDGETDRVAARQQGMMFAVGLGFSSSEATIVASAMSELAGTILVHAARGEIILSAMSHSVPPALTATALGQGEAMAGPAGVERFMDSFEIVSEVRPGLGPDVRPRLRRASQPIFDAERSEGLGIRSPRDSEPFLFLKGA